MRPLIKVYLLGGFRILVNGEDVAGIFHGSKKSSMLLQYLILHHKVAIRVTDLYDVLWSDCDKKNPESALKTMIFRLRASLNDVGISNAIVTTGNGYQWNSNLGIWVDIYEFDRLCDIVIKSNDLDGIIEDTYNRAIDIYKGDLLQTKNVERWVMTRSVYYHEKLVLMANCYIGRLHSAKKYECVVIACKRLQEREALDNTINLMYIDALSKLGRDMEAMYQYDTAIYPNISNLQDKSIDDVDIYNKLLINDRDAEDDLNKVKRYLLDSDGVYEAFECEYSLLSDIYRLNTRNLERFGITMFIILVTVSKASNEGFDRLSLDRVMKVMLRTLKKTLRKGDTISRYSLTQYILMLPLVNRDSGRKVMERVRDSFYGEKSNDGYIVNYKMSSL